MTRTEKVGLALLILLMVFLCGLFYWTFKRPRGPVHSPAESPIIQQRLINIEKSR